MFLMHGEDAIFAWRFTSPILKKTPSRLAFYAGGDGFGWINTPHQGPKRTRQHVSHSGPSNLRLGHANLSITSRYLDHIAPQERLGALKGREWRV